MAAKYDVRTSSDGQYYFNLKAATGKAIPTSERYPTKATRSRASTRSAATLRSPPGSTGAPRVAGEPCFVLQHELENPHQRH